MNKDMESLVKYMKDLNKQVILLETLGGLTRAVEVSPDSFVQLLECTKVPNGGYRWAFHQTWVEKMTQNDQKEIAGAYHNDTIGNFRIIGIFNPAPGLEMILPK